MQITLTVTLEEFDKIRAILEGGDSPAAPVAEEVPTIEQAELVRTAQAVMAQTGTGFIKEVLTKFGYRAMTEVKAADRIAVRDALLAAKGE